MPSARDTILAIDDLAERARAARAAGETVVLCHGCFDIVHPGHIRHLEQAARLGDRLVVTVTGDAGVGKGAGRPLIPQELRAENLAALDVVDWVAISSEPTAAQVLRAVEPDIYVKGREYEANHDPRFEEEKALVQSYGGRVVFSSGDVIFSSTALISALTETYEREHTAVRRLLDRLSVDDTTIDETIRGFRGRRVLVLGETIIDTYVSCDRPNVAGEGPMLALRPLDERSFDGGAAVIARHLAAMGARPTLLTALPAGPTSEPMRLRLEVEGVEVRSIDVTTPPIEKRRYLVGPDKLVRLDVGERLVIDDRDQRRFVSMARECAEDAEAAIIADFGLGLWSARSLTDVCAAVRPHVEVLSGDVSGPRSNLLAINDADLLCPSEMEVRDALQAHDEGLTAVVWRLLESTRTAGAIVTIGDQGLIAFERRAEMLGWDGRLHAEPVPSLVAHAVDPLGCGDALLSAATLTLLTKGPVGLAALVGSAAAAAEARKLGNAAIGAPELRGVLRRVCSSEITFESEAAAWAR